MTPARGDVWWIDYGTPIGHEQGYRRPGLVISRVIGSGLFVTAPITGIERAYPTRVPIHLARPSFVQVEQLRITSRDRFARHMHEASADVMTGVQRVLRLMLDL